MWPWAQIQQGKSRWAPPFDTWTLAADGRTLTHETNDSKEIFVYDKQ
jgi:hypothetical protein